MGVLIPPQGRPPPALPCRIRGGKCNGQGGCSQSDAADFERLIAVTPAAAVGDTLTYVLTPKGVRALSNNCAIGEFANPDLGLRLLAGFIGDVPPSADLKRHLLGAP